MSLVLGAEHSKLLPVKLKNFGVVWQWQQNINSILGGNNKKGPPVQ